MVRARTSARLIIMVREPKLGAVKTRLAADVGASEAIRFYRSTTVHLIRRLAADPRWRIVLAVAPDVVVSSRSWPASMPRLAQGMGDIGVRMERMLRAPGIGPAILIGSDIPGVQPDHIAEAIALLRANDAVFGPADDGGFWLVGLKPLPRLSGIFSNVRWSTGHALADTLANLRGRRIGLAARLVDVDDGDAYRRTGANSQRLTPQRG